MWDDLEVVRPFRTAPETEAPLVRGPRRAVAVAAHAPPESVRGVVGPAQPSDFNNDFDALDDWGWLKVPAFSDDQWLERRIDDMSRPVIAVGNAFNPSDGSRLAFTELLALCRQEKITPVLLATPDAICKGYAPDARRHGRLFVRRRRGEQRAPGQRAGVGRQERLLRWKSPDS